MTSSVNATAYIMEYEKQWEIMKSDRLVDNKA